ncbi:MAG: cysteine desulfurase [Magnetospirillum sp.]|nr:cysteine desulfurase [Magnetospirillum sp.]
MRWPRSSVGVRAVGIYLDHNAGGPVRPEVASAMAEALAEGGNPSSVHAGGRRARRRIEDARAQVAALIGIAPSAIVFTSGGSEANALALRGCGRERLLVSAVEHASVLECGAAVERIPVDGAGIVDLVALEHLLAGDARPALVSVMLANNETGVVQPVAAVAAMARRFGALVHCDAVQAAGRMAVAMSDLAVDFLTLSAHKMGGPSGIGALALRDADFPLAPILLGGGQERRRRAGTENLSGIVGFGVAATLAGDDVSTGNTILEMYHLRDALEPVATARVPGAVVVAAGAVRLPNTTCLVLPEVAGQTQVMALDLAGIAVSAGSACSSGKVGASHVLAAMGLGGMAGCAIRISLGRSSRAEEVTAFVDAWAELAARKGFEVRQAAKAA